LVTEKSWRIWALVYPEDMGLICRALALHGTAEAAER